MTDDVYAVKLQLLWHGDSLHMEATLDAEYDEARRVDDACPGVVLRPLDYVCNRYGGYEAILMPRCRGTLYDYLPGRGADQAQINTFLELAARSFEQLERFHRLGGVHGDVKLFNILIAGGDDPREAEQNAMSRGGEPRDPAGGRYPLLCDLATSLGLRHNRGTVMFRSDSHHRSVAAQECESLAYSLAYPHFPQMNRVTDVRILKSDAATRRIRAWVVAYLKEQCAWAPADNVSPTGANTDSTDSTGGFRTLRIEQHPGVAPIAHSERWVMAALRAAFWYEHEEMPHALIAATLRQGIIPLCKTRRPASGTVSNPLSADSGSIAGGTVSNPLSADSGSTASSTAGGTGRAIWPKADSKVRKLAVGRFKSRAGGRVASAIPLGRLHSDGGTVSNPLKADSGGAAASWRAAARKHAAGKNADPCLAW